MGMFLRFHPSGHSRVREAAPCGAVPRPRYDAHDHRRHAVDPFDRVVERLTRHRLQSPGAQRKMVDFAFPFSLIDLPGLLNASHDTVYEALSPKKDDFYPGKILFLIILTMLLTSSKPGATEKVRRKSNALEKQP